MLLDLIDPHMLIYSCISYEQNKKQIVRRQPCPSQHLETSEEGNASQAVLANLPNCTKSTMPKAITWMRQTRVQA